MKLVEKAEELVVGAVAPASTLHGGEFLRNRGVAQLIRERWVAGTPGTLQFIARVVCGVVGSEAL